MLKLFMTGTGTEVGKSYAVEKTAKFAIEHGKTVSLCKPVQTGLGFGHNDIKKITERIKNLNLFPENGIIDGYDLPASPHLAAFKENKKIDYRKLLSILIQGVNENKTDIFIAEGAGGLLVPLNEKKMMIDLIKDSNFHAILCSSALLGTINHTLLSIEALKKRKVKTAGIILNFFPENPGIIEKDNIKVIEKYSGEKVLALIQKNGELIEHHGFEELILNQDEPV